VTVRSAVLTQFAVPPTTGIQLDDTSLIIPMVRGPNERPSPDTLHYNVAVNRPVASDTNTGIFALDYDYGDEEVPLPPAPKYRNLTREQIFRPYNGTTVHERAGRVLCTVCCVCGVLASFTCVPSSCQTV
jgi:hypothetical protein